MGIVDHHIDVDARDLDNLEAAADSFDAAEPGDGVIEIEIKGLGNMERRDGVLHIESA